MLEWHGLAWSLVDTPYSIPGKRGRDAAMLPKNPLRCDPTHLFAPVRTCSHLFAPVHAFAGTVFVALWEGKRIATTLWRDPGERMRSHWVAASILAMLTSAMVACSPSSGSNPNDSGTGSDALVVADGAAADASSDGGTDAGTGGDAGTGPDASTEPECSVDGDCLGSNRGCLAGICRDRCVPWLDPCDWAPSGNICFSNYCVECNGNADCPGTRYTCDVSTHTCRDQPFDPSLTKIGVFYHTWHCPSSQDVHDDTQCLAGAEA